MSSRGSYQWGRGGQGQRGQRGRGGRGGRGRGGRGGRGQSYGPAPAPAPAPTPLPPRVPENGGVDQDKQERSRYLNSYFYKIIEGTSFVQSAADSARFVEAICNRDDMADCIERLASSQVGQKALHKALTLDSSAKFINNWVTRLLVRLSDPSLKRLCSGNLLNQVLWCMVDPPPFWTALLDHAKARAIEHPAMESFSWLLLQLVTLPLPQSAPFRSAAESLLSDEFVTDSPSPTSRGCFQRIKSLVKQSSRDQNDDIDAPGGRHDNDFVSYHDIGILPSKAELESSERPFLRSASAMMASNPEDRVHIHLDNQYRLLREDMLAELREDLQWARNTKKGNSKRNMLMKELYLVDIDREAMGSSRPCALVFQCKYDILKMPNMTVAQRKKALQNAPAFLKHQSFGCIMADNTPIAVATFIRNEDLLSKIKPQICLLVSEEESLRQIFLVTQTKPVDFLQVPTALFAYEPVLLRLKNKTDVELDHDILAYTDVPKPSPFTPAKIVDALKQKRVQTNFQQLLGTAKSLSLDESQVNALIMALTHQVACIQGPPGTGKSLVGAVLTSILLHHTEEKILVLSYTNHALDQFLEDLMDIGINDCHMVRLGSKSTARTARLSLSNQPQDLLRRTKTRWNSINLAKENLAEIANGVIYAFEASGQTPSLKQVLQHIEFSERDLRFIESFSIPSTNGETMIGPSGKPIQTTDLLLRWARGQDAGPIAKSKPGPFYAEIWKMHQSARSKKLNEWQSEIRDRGIKRLTESIHEYNLEHRKLQDLYKEASEQKLISKRIIGCTTTAASMYAQAIQAVAPGIIIVEEAGEILESHILAAMSPSVKHVIQIGDHKQLRPKAKNYGLTVESGRGYDINRSMFERLVLLERPHSTLLNQHRMRPEISKLIRHNYPNLEDAKGTENRDHLRGFQQDVVFVNHSHLEAKNNVLTDALDESAPSSKQNEFEADMILKCIRYLGQQRYRTADMVILTPYLGQLSLLKDRLSKDHDPVLSDLDSHDLVQAGLISAENARLNKKPIRLSTIDNYQGEESKIVLVSLTRSNDNGDIGFMQAPERLNVLISRARDALIMIGNAETFMKARKGQEEWARLLNSLKSTGNIHDGFPLRCEKHPDTLVTVRSIEDFEKHCPDGGCAQPCSEPLSCGHTCPKRCHILIDHSEMRCEELVKDICAQKHRISWRCHQKKPPCHTCRVEEEDRRHKEQRAKKLEEDRQARQVIYAKKLKAVKDEIDRVRQLAKDQQEDAMRKQTLDQLHLELENLKLENQKKPEDPQTQPSTAKKPKPVGKNKKGAQVPANSQKKPTPTNINLGSQKGSPNGPTNDASKTAGDTSDTSSAEGPGAGSPHDDPPSPAPESSGDESSQASDSDDDQMNDIPAVEVPFEKKESAAEKDWKHQKNFEGASNGALDTLMDMIGLESVKQEFLRIKARVDTAVRQSAELSSERFSAALLGNPGTGKTTVARLYAKLLSSVGAIPGDHFEETTGSRLANDGIPGCQALIDGILKQGGGVFFLDEAYQIVASSSAGGRQVLDFLLAEIENLRGKVVFVFAGYRKQMEEFFAHNPGIPSRVPVTLNFDDYEDEELLRIFNYQLGKKFAAGRQMQVERGPDGLYMRIVARRIARGRGHEGFGNAREVENVLARLLGRQAERLHRERRAGKVPDDMLLTKADLLGPEPNKAFVSNKDWQKMQKLVGLESVKQSVQVLVDRLQTNYERELREQPPVECSLNKCFLGNPGTGKTTVAKMYGGILVALGLLSNGEVVVKNPADFVGGALGQSEKNTKAILDSTKGKVLIIDEAYMLAGGGGGNSGGDGGGGSFSDPYKTAVVDTIVAEVQSTAGEDRCVLLLGYREQMEDMFRKVNPGLSRRFPAASGFQFDDYDAAQLRAILDRKLADQGFRAGDRAKGVVRDVLERARAKPNFGNAGEVDNLLRDAKDRQQRRLSADPAARARGADVLTAADFDPDFDRGRHAATNIRELFRDVIGCERIVEQLEGYQQVALGMKADGMDPRDGIPFGFLFRGPPGTGKTTTARRMGQIYYDMGLLSEAAVVECSATDLIGQFVGQTGPKVQRKFDEALGKVLFIDEAYRLAAPGAFAQEALDEIVDCVTKTRYHNRLVVVLAGYDDDINRLMAANPGLTRRFPEAVCFDNLPPHHCRDLLLGCLRGDKYRLDTAALEQSSAFAAAALDRFAALCGTKDWGNAGDVQTLAKNIFGQAMRKGAKTGGDGGAAAGTTPRRSVPEQVVLDEMDAMLCERIKRGASQVAPTGLFPTPPTPAPAVATAPPRVQPSFSTSTSTSTSADTIEDPQQEQEPPVEKEEEEEKGEEAQDPSTPSTITVQRDPGVSDAEWAQLQRDKAAAAQRRRDLEAAQRKAAELRAKVEQAEAEARDAGAGEGADGQTGQQKQEQEAKVDDGGEDEEARRRRYEALRALEVARLESDAADRERRQLEARMQRELEAQRKLRRMGRCMAGFEWIARNGGYQCAGGSHFVTEAELGLDGGAE